MLRPLVLAYMALIQSVQLPIIPHKLVLRVWWSESRISPIYRSAVLLLTALLILGVFERTSSDQTHDIRAVEAHYPSQEGMLRKRTVQIAGTLKIEMKEEEEEDRSLKYKATKRKRKKKTKKTKKKKKKTTKKKMKEKITKGNKYKNKDDELGEEVDEPEDDSTMVENGELESDLEDDSEIADPSELKPSEELPSETVSTDAPKKPTSAPNSKPHRTPTSTPAPQPDEGETEPTSDESEVETLSLTFGPTTTPASSSDKACQLLPSGSFGETSAERRDVNFFYQVESLPTVTYQAVNEALLPLLEDALAVQLLAVLFAECKNGSLLRGETNTCEAKGYSGLPLDRVLLGVACIGTRDDPSNNCYVVDAGAGLFLESETACPDAVERTKTEIKKVIDSGSIDEFEDRIVSVQYVEELDLNFSTTNAAQGSSDSINASGPLLPVYACVLIGVGGVTSILAVGMALKRRRRSAADERTLNIKPIDGMDIVDAPSISDNTWYDQAQPSDKLIDPVSEGGETLYSDENDAMHPNYEAQEDDSPNVESAGKDSDISPNMESGDKDGNLPHAPPPEVEETSGDESSDGESPNTGTDETTVKIKN